ncbi:MAG: hypothetical protein LUO89_01570 [Methanothrix sp.]|nr:hypothetical protein [Methanothrix sp.]
MAIVGIAQIYESWIGHALIAILGLMLMISVLVTGAMLKGRIKKKQTNLFSLHKKIAVYFSMFVLGTFLYGLLIKMQHEELVLRSSHGRLGLILVLIVIFQLVPSLTLKDRNMIRKPHMVLGYALAPLMFLEASWGLYNGVVAGSKSLVLVHSMSGGLTALVLVWIILEMIYLTESGVVRAKIAGYIGAFLVTAGCWIAGGYNYLTVYGSQVKPIILAGPKPWAHSIVMEVKEHIFVFLPIIIIALSLTLAILDKNVLLKDPVARRAIAITASLAIFMVLLMFLMGAIISSAGNVRLEA